MDGTVKKSRVKEALLNGPGTVITRLIIMAMPIIFSASVWIGGKALDLAIDKVMGAIERIEKRLDKIETGQEQIKEFDRTIELKVQRNSDDVEHLKDMAERTSDRRRQ